MTEPSMKILTQEETQGTNKTDNMVPKIDGEKIKIGDLDLEGLEVACYEKVPE